MYEFRADETTFYIVAFAMSFIVCIVLDYNDRDRRYGGVLIVGLATALVSCGIVGLTLAICSGIGAPVTSPWPGLGMATILGSMRHRVFSIAWEMLKLFWRGRIKFVVDEKEQDK